MIAVTNNGVFPNDIPSAARAYLAMGIAPIPMHHQSKCPVNKDSKNLRVTPETVDQYFPANTLLNIGILTGDPSNRLVDVDLDCDEARILANKLLPSTNCIFGHMTSQRSHWIYRGDKSHDSASEMLTDTDGTVLLELRGNGSFTVAPPSTHKETGEAIVWESFGDPPSLKLEDLLRAGRTLGAATLLARHWPGEGSRQHCYLALSGALLRGGWAKERVETFIDALSTVVLDDEKGKRVQTVGQTSDKLSKDSKTTGWPKLQELLGSKGPEVISKVRKWLEFEDAGSPGKTSIASQVRKLLPFQPFPVPALPDPISTFIDQGSKALGCDTAFFALPVMAAVSSAIGNTRTIQLKSSWSEPSILWTVIVGDSGTLKSPALQHALLPLWTWQNKLFKEYNEKRLKYGNDVQVAKVSNKKGAQGSIPDEPLLKRVIVNDITLEKLALILEENPRGVLLARDELAGWLGSFTRYKNAGASSDLPYWLELHRAGSFIMDRKTGDRNTTRVERGAVSVTGGIQPGVLARALSPVFFESGFSARLLMAMPPKLPKRWSEDEIDTKVTQKYQDLLCKLLDLNFNSTNEELQPHVLQLSPEAKTTWVEYYNHWGQEQFKAEGERAAAFSKLEGYTIRFALLHHVVSRIVLGKDDLVPIERESIEAGIAISKWFADESCRIYSMLSESATESAARRLIEWIQNQGGKTTVKELQKSNSKKYPTAEIANQALDALCKGGHGYWANRVGDSKGGRPTRDFILDPRDDESNQTGSDDLESDGDQVVTLPPTAPSPSNGGVNFPEVSQVSSVSSDVESKECDTSGSSLHQLPGGLGVSSDTTSYTLINNEVGMEGVIASLYKCVMVGLSLTTIGLDQRTGEIRLLSLACKFTSSVVTTYLIDCFALDPSNLWTALAKKELVIHNAAFVLAILARKGFTTDSKIHDTKLLAQLLHAGTGKEATVQDCCNTWLNMTLKKKVQESEYTGVLTPSHLDDAAKDAELLHRLLEVLSAKINEAGLTETASIELKCLPAVNWLTQNGVPFNRNSLHKIAVDATDETKRLRNEMHQIAPKKPGGGNGEWNWNSPQQVEQVLSLAGCKVSDTTDETLSSIPHPLAQLIRCYRSAQKCVGIYGINWIDQHVSAEGRVYPSWKQIGAVTGRMSCRGPNMQQLPRGDFRRCVEAPSGRTLVKADYSQIELRIAARISGDAALLDAFQRGEDLHIRTAQSVLGIKEVRAEHRQLAKALNFGLLYGMGPPRFQQYAMNNYNLKLTLDQAYKYRDAFFRSYPGLEVWHNKVRSMKANQTRTLSGRRRLFDLNSRDTDRLNTPVQGTGADGLKLAMGLLWERRHQVPGAFPVLVVHDEIVFECDTDQAGVVSAWLKSAMEDAMKELIQPVPVAIEMHTSKTWGGDPTEIGNQAPVISTEPHLLTEHHHLAFEGTQK